MKDPIFVYISAGLFVVAWGGAMISLMRLKRSHDALRKMLNKE